MGSKISAAVRLLQFKAAAQGLAEEDLYPLQQALDEVRALESPLTSRLVEDGVKAAELYRRHAAASAGLEQALASGEIKGDAVNNLQDAAAGAEADRKVLHREEWCS
jgi:hypothetical protein